MTTENTFDFELDNLEPDAASVFKGFQDLMRYRIRNVILVSSLYDLYVFEEDGRLYELIRDEYRGLNLSEAPELTRVSSGWRALELAKTDKRYDLIITTPHIEDMDVGTFAKRVHEADLDIPIVLLTYDNRETSELLASYSAELFDRVFIWQGDFRILIAIIKHLEDSVNVEHDTRRVGVQTIILVEDSVRYYSSFLPIIYVELFEQSQRLISEGINLSDRYLRMRARPKILLCTNYEDAWYNFEKYREYILGIISDVDFSRDGVKDPRAGLEFAKNVKALQDDIPIMLQSTSPSYQQEAHEVGASFLLKNSPTLLNDLRKFMSEQFGFGDFIFRTPDNKEVGRAHDLISLEKMLEVVPEESLRYHADRNHFSKWLKARTEFWLAHKLRPRKISEFKSIEDFRKSVIQYLRDYRKSRTRGAITDFKKDTFDVNDGFARIGGGSLGGKARGLSFVNLLVNRIRLTEKYPDVRIQVPPTVVLGTEVFDEFLERNNLRDLALSGSLSDEALTERFLAAERFPSDALFQLTQFLNLMREPLAVRSSSLLEDSQYHPFAGVYSTFMLPNSHFNAEVRLNELLNAIKMVYASTFYERAKSYVNMATYLIEEEKMAIIIQKMVGRKHKNRFYPDFSGVAKSHNFYPISPQKASDGIAAVALGLGKTVVEGGNSVKFCPKYPRHIHQFSSIDEILKNNQRLFYALDLNAQVLPTSESYEKIIKPYPISEAEADGTLYAVGSTYSHENHAIYDGLSRPGMRLVTFSPLLKNNLFPLPEILQDLLNIGRKGMGTPVELEFAVNTSVAPGEPKEFGILQLRPMVLSKEAEQLDVEHVPEEELICYSSKVMGNGILKNIYDIVMVDYEKFERAKTREVAAEIHKFNSRLLEESRPYILIGMGRWGSMDPWLGIPVRWEQISGARVIVEAAFKDLDVEPSQGSHFFHNITSFMIGYFTIAAAADTDFIDWEWLQQQKPFAKNQLVRHLRFNESLVVKMNGRKNKGIIYKPGVAPESQNTAD